MRTLHRVFVCLVLVACASAPAQQRSAEAPPQQPPVAPKQAHVIQLNGDTLRDDYFWLRNKDTPEVEAYLRAEAAYADAMMKPTEAVQKTLYDEMLSHIQEDDSTPQVRIGSYWYYQRTEKGKQYPILCRKAAPDAPEQVILDVNALAAGKKFLGLGGWEVSDDGTRLAYTTDETGFRQYDLHVRDLRSGADGPERIARVDSVAWSRDGKVLFYVVEDEQEKRPYQLWRHTVGSASKDDLIYEEKDHSFNLEVDRSRSKDFIFVTSASHTTSEVRFFGAGDPNAALVLIRPREPEHEYYADARGATLYIRTNSGGRNFRLVTAQVSAPRKENWKEVVAHRDDVMLQDVEVFRDFVALYEREDGLPQITFLDPSTGARRRVQFPEADYEVSPDKNPEYDQKELRVVYQSPVTPQSWIDVDAASLAQKVVKRQPVPNYDSSRYQVERVWAAATDGTNIPIAVLHKEGIARDGKGALLLYGYGSYGIDIPDRFNSNLFSLVDRNVTFAVAHIRGGGELGKKWHDQGRMMNKMNTFTDFIACAEHLIAQGYTSKDRLAIMGGSAGGLLMGAVTNLRPDLFHTVVTYVPFVDVINTMLDESLPLTISEFEEWGNPKKPDEYRYMKQYSPYDNVVAKAYPTMLVRSSYNDSQVMYWEPAKYVAKLRAVKTDSNPLLFHIKMDPAGHGGASGRYDRLKDVAYDYAFILRQLAPSP
ncbi:MAG: S9 family peptidase [Deltaproteobacteria bacterium]|nr:MAG: S9 family peptidase [Deltaproteobacteria bacterium]